MPEMRRHRQQALKDERLRRQHGGGGAGQQPHRGHSQPGEPSVQQQALAAPSLEAGSVPASSSAPQAATRAQLTQAGRKRLRSKDPRARITINGTKYYVGRHDSVEAAAQAEDFAVLWQFGDQSGDA